MTKPRRPPELLSRPFTSRQAKAAGLTTSQLRSSAWRRLFHDVYVAADVADTFTVRAEAVKLVLPADAVVGYATAAWLHGVDVRASRSLVAVDVIAQRGDQI